VGELNNALRVELTTRSRSIRKRVLEAVFHAGKGHLGGALSIAEILSVLYFSGLFNLGLHSKKDSSDKFILSKGHAGVALYATLVEVGWVEETELFRLNKGFLLAEHPSPEIPGVDFVSGSLGHGLSVGAGMALADKIDMSDKKTAVLLGDGECYEGTVWEAAQFASHHRLNSLLAIVDRNGLITHGPTEEINSFGSLVERWESFGWHAIEVDGHDLGELFSAISEFHGSTTQKPTVILAETIKGKGFSSLQGLAASHHGSISKSELEESIRELGVS
jgi:transketolase